MGKRLTPEQVDRIVEMKEAGSSHREIAAAVGCTVSAAAWQVLRTGAVSPRPKIHQPYTGPATVVRGGHVVRRFTPEDDARLLELEAAGTTDREIGLALNRRPNSIRGRLMTLARHEARAEQQSTSPQGRAPAAERAP